MSSRSSSAAHPFVDVARIARITQQLYERQRFAYFLVDHEWRWLEASDNLSDFGFTAPGLDQDARQSIDFLVGLDTTTTLDLPIVMSPNEHPVHIVMLPDDEVLTVVIMDASREYEQQQLVQQQANENELLLAKQKVLLAELQSAQLALREKNAQLSEAGRLQNSFISGASHEFRTPLAALLGYADLLKERINTQSTSKSRDQVDVIRRSAQHLLSLVENLLDHGKFTAAELVLNPQPTDINSLLDEVHAMLRPLAADKHIELEFSAPRNPLPDCMLDASRVRQLLLNVVGNAIKFTDQGSVTVQSQWQDDELEIAVIDTGIGLSADELQMVTTAFWQAPGSDRHGTGLGLTISQQILQMSGGALHIESVAGEGTKVLMQMPAVKATRAQMIDQDAQSAVAQARLLLAEDDQDIADLLKLRLSERGLDITHAENGQQVLELLDAERFDLILMDLQMPIMDGYTATEKIRTAGITTPILVMTASAIEADRSRAELVGCDGYVLKPVDIDNLLLLAEELIEAHAVPQTENL